MKGKSMSMLLCSGVDAFHLRVSGRRGEVDLKRRLCFGFSYLPKTMCCYLSFVTWQDYFSEGDDEVDSCN